MKEKKILVAKTEGYIMIVSEGIKMLIYGENPLFILLNKLTKEEIKDWYKNRK